MRDRPDGQVELKCSRGSCSSSPGSRTPGSRTPPKRARDVRLVLLDRDGVVNEDSDAYVKSVAEWLPVRGSLEAIARLHRAGFAVVVLSNQSGLARGLFDRAALDAIHREMCARVEAVGGRIAGVFFCPHCQDEGCGCRKPEPGLFHQVERALGASVEGAPFVGDKASDLEAARRAGCVPILVRTGKGAATERAGLGLEGSRIFDDLAQAVDFLISSA
jgi:D-glycero-D-manno-heptose 1,7-bisphosphate phosphatase